MTNAEYCPECSEEVNCTLAECLNCKHPLGVPNQRELRVTNEVDELARRYQTAIAEAKKNGVASECRAFEQQVKSNSKAIMCMSAKLLDDFLSSENLLISNYNLQTSAELRTSADMYEDRQRHGTGGTLYGDYSPKIRYAAVSLDNKGLISYGNCCVAISDRTMEKSATVMEENSYTFVRKHRILPGDEIPTGYRAVWTDRHILAVAKLAAGMSSGQKFNKLLLSSDGNRKNDDFMEVHIYGTFNNRSIDGIAVPIKMEKEKAMIMRIRDYAAKRNITCENYD